MGNSGKLQEDAVAIAVVATDVRNVKDTVEKIEGKLDKFFENAASFKVDIATTNKRVDATEKDIRGLHKRVSEVATSLGTDIDKIAENSRADLDMHEAHCVAREFVAARLAKPSRNPAKDTPREIKRPSLEEHSKNGMSPLKIAYIVGAGIAVFVFIFLKLKGWL